MSILIEADLEVSSRGHFNCLSTDSLSATEFNAKIVKAFNATRPIENVDLPEPVQVISKRKVIVCQSLAGSAKLYVVGCDESLSDAPNTSTVVVVYADEELLHPEECVRAIHKRFKQANRACKELNVGKPKQFKVYPLPNDAREFAGEEDFYLLARFESQWSQRFKEMGICTLVCILSCLFGFFFKEHEQEQVVNKFLADLLTSLIPGGILGVLFTVLYEGWRDKGSVSIGLDGTVNRETKRKNNRTEEIIASYEDVTPPLRRSPQTPALRRSPKRSNIDD